MLVKYNDKTISVSDFYFNKGELMFVTTNNFSYDKLIYPASECKLIGGDYRIFYYKLLKAYREKYKEWREGQSMINVLKEHFPDLYEKHSTAQYNCFNNDKLIGEFMKKINKDLVFYEYNN